MAEEERDDYGGGYYRQPSLGELTRGIASERGELQDYDLRGPAGVPPQSPGGPTAVADLQRATGIVDYTENNRVSLRPPALLYQVVSTFDSRPIQSYDFQDSECSFINLAGVPPVFAPFNALTYIVPENTVAVLRQFRYQVIDAPVNAVVEGDCWLQSDLFVNDLPVREYNKMTLPVFMEDAFDTFVIIDERLELRLRLSIFDPNNTEFSQTLNGLQFPVIASFYGNLILKTGVPIEFEIANAIGGGQL
jgi:hypothetical protein